MIELELIKHSVFAPLCVSEKAEKTVEGRVIEKMCTGSRSAYDVAVTLQKELDTAHKKLEVLKECDQILFNIQQCTSGCVLCDSGKEAVADVLSRIKS